MVFRSIFWGAISSLCFAHAAAACISDYTVRSGDTLSRIADRLLGSPFAAQALYEDNRDVIGSDPDVLKVGQILRYACDGRPAQDMNWAVMPNPETVARVMADTPLQVLDIRKAKQVSKGVVPGAISIPYSRWRGPKENRGAPLSGAEIAALVGEAGLQLDAPIVIVHAKEHPMETGAAAVVYWQLKSVGADHLAIMRGGFKGWKTAGLPITSAPREPAPYITFLKFEDTWKADIDTVTRIVLQHQPGELLDARPHSVFDKVDKLGRAVASTLPGAHNLPAPALLSALKGDIDAADGARKVVAAFRKLGVDRPNVPIVTFCHVGELGALNWFYASELAGLPNIKLYPESLNGWTRAGGPLFFGKRG